MGIPEWNAPSDGVRLRERPSCALLAQLWSRRPLLRTVQRIYAAEFHEGGYSIEPVPVPVNACSNRGKDSRTASRGVDIQAMRDAWWTRCCSSPRREVTQ